MCDIVLKNGTLVTEDGIIKKDLRIKKEKIVEISNNILTDCNDNIIDVDGKIVFPGIIDSHVHYKMFIDKLCTIDNFETGSRSALCGGVTTIIDYADQKKGNQLNLL